MEIKVFSEEGVQRFITNKKHIVISLQDPTYDFVQLPEQESRVDWLGIYCYDLDKDIGQFPYSRYMFEKHHAKEIIKFVEVRKQAIDLIIVNCVAGVSRSAGVAAALSKILNKDDMYFFKNYWPNMRIYSFILEEYFGKVFKDYNKKDIEPNNNINFF